MRKIVVAAWMVVVSQGAVVKTSFADVPNSLFVNFSQPIGVAVVTNRLLVSPYCSDNNIYGYDDAGNQSVYGTISPGVLESGCVEKYLAVAPGLNGHFNNGDLFVTHGPSIVRIPSGGGPGSLFATLPSACGTHTGINFDHVGTWNNDMILTTCNGNVYRVNDLGVVTPVIPIGTLAGVFLEGPDVAPLSFSPYGGDILAASENVSAVYAFSPSGSFGTIISYPSAESIHVVVPNPCSLGKTGSAFFTAIYSTHIQQFSTSDFIGIAGQVLVTSEGGGIGLMKSSGGVISISNWQSSIGQHEGSAFVDCTATQCVGQADGASCNDGNNCTQSDVCKAGVCVGTQPTVCQALDNCHVAGVCNPGTGVCSNPPTPNGLACLGTTCANGACTCTTGSCVNGICSGVTTSCNATQCTIATCDAMTMSCGQSPAPNGTACNDGNACTNNDSCGGGSCAGTPVNCVAQDSCHDKGACDPNFGICTNPVRPNGSACATGNLCIQNSTCTNGTCNGTPVTCAPIDQCHTAGACDPTTGICAQQAKPNGSTCNDGNACTTSDSCQSGACVGTPVTCAASDQCHSAACNPMTGACVQTALTNGTSCNDGNACTQTDSCQSGTCVGMNPVICTASDQCHVAGTCNPNSGACSNPTQPDGTACNDGNACTQTDSCQLGGCSGANPIVCFPSDQCHKAGSCDPNSGVCSNPSKTDGTACNDGNACTLADSCSAGLCVGMMPVICTASDQCHVPGTCDTNSGLCSNPAAQNGTTCSDMNACTTTDTCQAGSCSSGPPLVCQNGNVCQTPSCNPQSGCVFSGPQFCGTGLITLINATNTPGKNGIINKVNQFAATCPPGPPANSGTFNGFCHQVQNNPHLTAAEKAAILAYAQALCMTQCM